MVPTGMFAERHGVARLHVDMLARDHRVAGREPLRRQDVGELAVLVFDQRDEAVRFGSYSSRSTFAGTSNLRRLKSTMR